MHRPNGPPSRTESEDHHLSVPTPGTAMVVIGPAPTAAEPNHSSHSYAPFVAQLIATAASMPQTRRLRRAGGPAADAAYRSASRLLETARQPLV